MITPDNMASVISNEFRGVKRKLLQKARDPGNRAAVNNLIMVTSSLPGEGKTFTSINLAISLAAERGLKVLLDRCRRRASLNRQCVQIGAPGRADGSSERQERACVRCHVPLRRIAQSGRDLLRQVQR